MLEIIEDATGFEKLRHEWDELLQASSSDCLFLTWEWLHTWWKHLSDGRRLSILGVRTDGKLAAIAPLALRNRRLRGLMPFRALEFLGVGSVGSTYLDVIVRRENTGEVVPALAGYLGAQGVVLGLSQVKTDACVAAEVAAELQRRKWTARPATISVCPRIDLSGHSWDSYLASVGPTHFERNFRNLTKRFDVRFEQVLSEEQRRPALTQLLSMHDLRWKDRGGSEAFHTTRLRTFHEELTQLALERGWLRLFVLSLDGKPAAALYGFRYRDSFYFYQSGFDPAYQKYSIGFITVGLTIRRAIEEGAAEYDFLGGAESYKFRWARDTRELSRLELYPPRTFGRLCQHVMAVRRAAGTGSRAVRRSLAHRVASLKLAPHLSCDLW